MLNRVHKYLSNHIYSAHFLNIFCENLVICLKLHLIIKQKSDPCDFLISFTKFAVVFLYYQTIRAGGDYYIKKRYKTKNCRYNRFE